MTTLVDGLASRMRCNVSRPSAPGITMSSSTRSGVVALHFVQRLPAPLEAVDHAIGIQLQNRLQIPQHARFIIHHKDVASAHCSSAKRLGVRIQQNQEGELAARFQARSRPRSFRRADCTRRRAMASPRPYPSARVPCGSQAEVFVEDLLLEFGRNAGTGVGHRNAAAVGGVDPLLAALDLRAALHSAPLPEIGFHMQPYRPRRRRVLHGIVEQVGDHVLNFVVIEGERLQLVSWAGSRRRWPCPGSAAPRLPRSH